MSTNCCIILKVRDTDKGKLLSFNKSKLPLVLKNWKAFDKNNNLIWDRTGIDTTNPIMVNSDFIAIYCHWDGDDVGETLKEHFNDYETALNLLVGGFCSGIASGHVAHYANRNIDKWCNIKPIQGSFNKVYETIYGRYTYLFEDGIWKVGKMKESFHKF
jgi:hypothetical protein